MARPDPADGRPARTPPPTGSTDAPAASTTTPPPGWLLVGHVRRPHGLAGDCFVQLISDRDERLEPGAELFADGRRLTVRRRRRAGNGRMIVGFAEVADRTAAESMTNAELYGAPIDDPDALWVHELIGRPVVDQHGTDRGRCRAVVANPASDLLELDSGALVPTAFVTGVVDGAIRVDVPEGLFELAGEGT